MNSFKWLNSSAFLRAISHARQPMRSFVVSKIVPAATGAVIFGMGCMSKSCVCMGIFTLHAQSDPDARHWLQLCVAPFLPLRLVGHQMGTHSFGIS